MPLELNHAGYLISDDPARLNIDAIHAYLSRESYWAKAIPREVVARSLEHSLCLGVYTAASEQVGLARAITDSATFAWLCDVYILTPHRGRGLSKALIEALLAHPRLRGLRRISLGTRDAHGLYARFGFTPLDDPHSQMEKRDREVYQRVQVG